MRRCAVAIFRSAVLTLFLTARPIGILEAQTPGRDSAAPDTLVSESREPDAIETLPSHRAIVVIATPRAATRAWKDTLPALAGTICAVNPETRRASDTLIASLHNLADPGAVVISVVPWHRPVRNCAAPELLATHGVQTGPPGAPRGVRRGTIPVRVERVLLVRGADTLVPLGALAIEPDVVDQPDAPRLERLSEFRMIVPGTALAPDSLGRFPRLTLHVTYAPHAAGTDVLELPEATARRLWLASVPWQLVRRQATARVTADTRAIGLPPIHDPVLRRALATYTAGDVVAGAAAALQRARATGLGRRDELAAMLAVAATLLVVGDGPGAHALLAEVLSLAPCLTLPGDSPTPLRAAIERLRPRRERCTVQSSRSVMLAAILPGGGQLRTGHRLEAALGAAATGGFAAVALASHLDGNRQYAAYEAATEQWKATDLFRLATTRRERARRMTTAAAVTWGAAALEAVVHEWIHARRVAAYRAFGGSVSRGPHRTSLVPIVGPTAAGVALHLPF